jgi:rod shape determining protein RodA
MDRRSWRNFDWGVLLALVLLLALGVTMVHSATINSPGLEEHARRQAIYGVAGVVLLLLTAAIDYRLWYVLQPPIPMLTPLLLSLAIPAALAIPRLFSGSLDAISLDLWAPDVPAILLGLALVWGSFVFDRWLRKTNLRLRARLALGLFVGASWAGVGVLWLHLPQPILIATGVPALFVLDSLSIRALDALHNPFYMVVLGMLAVLFALGQVRGGAQRWLDFGVVTAQPSELAKVLMVLILARFFADHEDEMESPRPALASLVVTAIPMGLIYLQPDLGTALIVGASWLVMVWVAGLRLRHLALLAATSAAGAPLVWANLETYMRDRLLLFLNPAGNPQARYNLDQALISIGSGGWVGKGLNQGSQSQLHFLRVRHTDYVFSVLAEELGLVGTVLLLALMLFLLWRLLAIAGRAKDTFGRLVAVGIATIILFQSVVNISMNLGLMPVTGLPLPFMSYGGSSLLPLMAGLGLVQSVAMRYKKLEFD